MIFDYFGEEITFYFAFMNHYSKCLGFGALLSLIYYVYTKLQAVYCRYYLDVCHPDRRDVVPLLVFSVSILFGTALFIKFWERRFSYLHMKYNLFTHGDGTGANTTHNNKIEARKEFKADMIVKNKITNEFEKFYPRWKRELIKQPLSWVVLLLFTGFSLFCMVVCLNMEGMVVRVDRHHRQTDSTVTNRPTPALHIASLHRLSEDGRIFDKRQHLLGGYLPKILYSVVVMLCSQIFQVVATALNDFENYEIMSEYNKNFTIKRIFFEFFQ
ncbi:hypothetical protein AGDE_15630 [Angomonas deanei]|uniref:Calcium-activated chloride channel, putative n=1 Tax=Angomonas deanei TaxID=59799 RepID=A0A7G2CI95_9TRYP|nr:hypothetical protein AGDE_15630 [Angomonas deanei]CAD2219568.1 Calcium-activated chloride channel, putative [Angomonas deanei]|eukprot:EPY18731.1 hypothetical protein AGDE_15630 [Angomonas deanei]